MKLAASGLSGFLFGLGLCVSGMIDPARVIGFLDVTGAWDPTLAYVMMGALAVAIPGFRAAFRVGRPLFDAEFETRGARTRPDLRMAAGALLFGVGWGLAGLCPGPALVNLVSGHSEIFQFVIAMLLGFILADRPPASLCTTD